MCKAFWLKTSNFLVIVSSQSEREDIKGFTLSKVLPYYWDLHNPDGGVHK